MNDVNSATHVDRDTTLYPGWPLNNRDGHIIPGMTTLNPDWPHFTRDDHFKPEPPQNLTLLRKRGDAKDESPPPIKG